jgi:hypothetical protein
VKVIRLTDEQYDALYDALETGESDTLSIIQEYGTASAANAFEDDNFYRRLRVAILENTSEE